MTPRTKRELLALAFLALLVAAFLAFLGYRALEQPDPSPTPSPTGRCGAVMCWPGG